MSEKIPERIEREMFEIRSRMEPDVVDLKKHVEPQVVAERVKKTARERFEDLKQKARERIQEALGRLRSNLEARSQELLDSGRGQLKLAEKAGKERDPAPFTDAVKSDPRPLAILAVLLAIVLLTLRRATRD
jgi:F0F1-type ATP synthase membrane subunit b/b'